MPEYQTGYEFPCAIGDDGGAYSPAYPSDPNISYGDCGASEYWDPNQPVGLPFGNLDNVHVGPLQIPSVVQAMAEAGNAARMADEASHVGQVASAAGHGGEAAGEVASAASHGGAGHLIPQVLGPFTLANGINHIAHAEHAGDVAAGAADIVSGGVSTLGLAGTVTGNTALSSAATALNPVGAVAGSFALGYTVGTWLDQATGLSDWISDETSGINDVAKQNGVHFVDSGSKEHAEWLARKRAKAMAHHAE